MKCYLSYFSLIYLSIPTAACLPAPMANITVAAPVTASPPANTPSLEVCPFSSVTIQPLLFISRPWVVAGISGFGDALSHYNRIHITSNSEPSIGIGLLLP